MKNLNKSGIYIIHGPERKVYVGQAFNFRKRWNIHRSALNRSTHHCESLQLDWWLFGASSFTFEIIEETDVEYLDSREEYYMNIADKLYNVKHYVVTGKQSFMHSKESKVKMGWDKRKPVVLKNGLTFISISSFAKACGYLNHSSVSSLLLNGRTLDEIAEIRGLQSGNYKIGHGKKQPIILSDGQQFASKSQFAYACGYSSSANFDVMLKRGHTYDSLAKLRGIYKIKVDS